MILPVRTQYVKCKQGDFQINAISKKVSNLTIKDPVNKEPAKILFLFSNFVQNCSSFFALIANEELQ